MQYLSDYLIPKTQLRILLVSTTSRMSVMQGFHFTIRKNTVMKLPKFDILPPNISSPVHPTDIVVTQMYTDTLTTLLTNVDILLSIVFM